MVKKRLFSLAVIVICLSIAGAGTLAYFSDRTVAHNVITSGNIKIDLLEWQEGPDGWVSYPKEEISVMPGTSVSKIVQVENVGNNEAWIRVKVDKTITKADGETGDAKLLEIRYKEEDAYNRQDWELKDDGYYYYKEKLLPAQKTGVLFDTVIFDPDMDNDYQNSTAQVSVYAQATQVANNGERAQDAQGWPQD